MTPAPEKLPSGGLFAIKNFHLDGLYAEHQYCRNFWTKSNNQLPLVRYLGCQIKFYHSENIDYIASWDTTLPLHSNLDMYETMQPSIHLMVKHKKIITKKRPNQKPYTKVFIKPPSPLQNKWYFQADICKTPLLQIRASATNLDEYYINYKNVSTTLTITYLNTGLIENTCFKFNDTSGYYCRKVTNTETKVYLYTTTNNQPIQNNTLIKNLIFLGQTQKNQPGQGFQKGREPTFLENYTRDKWGNPFYYKYLKKEALIYFTTETVANIAKLYTSETSTLEQIATQFTITHIIDAIRYNPFRDEANKNSIYLKSVKEYTTKWKPPESPDLIQTNLPLWLLTFGFTDYQKKLKKAKDIDTDYMVVLTSNIESPSLEKIYPVVDITWIQGKSPFENEANPQDNERWWPCTQFQQITLNNIALSGPGSIKTPPLQAVQAKIGYKFFFKWGGTLPEPEGITNPEDQEHYHLPTKNSTTNSLQSPATRPETILHCFDKRRDYYTQKALERICKDSPTKKSFITDGTTLQPVLQARTEETPESSTSEEEEETETLLYKLQQQRRKHKQLKQRIMEHLLHQQKFE